MMKREIALCVTLTLSAAVFSACNNGSGENTRGSSAGSAAFAAVSTSQELMTSQKDAFHSASKIESARKGKLTSFGMIQSALPPETLRLEAAGVMLNPPDMKKMNIQRLENESLVIPAFPFDYENDIAALKSLFQMHGLDKIIRPGMTDMEKLSALSRYTYRFLEGGTVPPAGTEAGPSALQITRDRREKGMGGTSATYAALFCQLALSTGYNARLVGMHTLDDAGKPLSNDICEVYVNYFNKWVAFDAFNRATYYVRGAIPLSALDIHSSVVEGRMREISPVSEVADLGEVASLRDQLLPRYKHLYLWRMNDILGKSPRGGSVPWQTLYQAHLVWEDRYSPVSKGGFDKIDRFANGGVKFVTHERSDFEWTLNLVNITIQRSGEETVKLYYNTITPNFDHFEYSVAGDHAKAAGVNEYKNPTALFQISSVNAFGVKGRVSTIELSQ